MGEQRNATEFLLRKKIVGKYILEDQDSMIFFLSKSSKSK
jgi:hypothetical protein